MAESRDEPWHRDECSDELTDRDPQRAEGRYKGEAGDDGDDGAHDRDTPDQTGATESRERCDGNDSDRNDRSEAGEQHECRQCGQPLVGVDDVNEIASGGGGGSPQPGARDGARATARLPCREACPGDLACSRAGASRNARSATPCKLLEEIETAFVRSVPSH